MSSLLQLPNVDTVYADASECSLEPWCREAEILQISLQRWHVLLVIAPLFAKSLIANL